MLTETLVQSGTAGAGRMVPPASTGISDRMRRAQEHGSPVKVALHTRVGRGSNPRFHARFDSL